MTAIEVTMWALQCDLEDCDVRTDRNGHSVWLTRELALTDIERRDRFLGFSEEDGKHYCPMHSGYCEFCDTRRPLHLMVQDEEEGYWQCRTHLTDPDSGMTAEDRERIALAIKLRRKGLPA